jgi:hypothetical protein
MKSNSDGQQFHKYQEIEQPTITLIFFSCLFRSEYKKIKNKRLDFNGVFFLVRAMTLF